jgi:hypothetical protein
MMFQSIRMAINKGKDRTKLLDFGKNLVFSARVISFCFGRKPFWLKVFGPLLLRRRKI